VSGETKLTTLLTIYSVIVAAGLIALVDDCIKRRFHTRPVRGTVMPFPKSRSELDYMGTGALGSGDRHDRRPSTRDSTASRRPTPLRKGSCDV
jgi:hypothetical protein